MKTIACFLLISTAIIAEDAIKVDSAYQEYLRIDQAVGESCQNYFKRDSLNRAWNERIEFPKKLLRIIQQDVIKDSIQLERKRLALLSEYKIGEVRAFLSQHPFYKRERKNER